MQTTNIQIQRIISFIGIVAICLILIACGGGGQSNNPNPPTSPEPGTLPDLAFTGSYEFRFQKYLEPTNNPYYFLLVEIVNNSNTNIQSFNVHGDYKTTGISGPLMHLDDNGNERWTATGGINEEYSLAPREKKFIRLQFILEKETIGQDYNFSLSLDPSNAIQEENEGNNQLVFTKRF
jgi:hypothetical protein